MFIGRGDGRGDDWLHVSMAARMAAARIGSRGEWWFWRFVAARRRGGNQWLAAVMVGGSHDW